MFSVQNIGTKQRKVLNKVLGDATTLKEAEEKSGYYDEDNQQFLPLFDENSQLFGFVRKIDQNKLPNKDIIWKLLIY